MSRLVVVSLRAAHTLQGWRPGEQREVNADEAAALLAEHPELVAEPQSLQEPPVVLVR